MVAVIVSSTELSAQPLSSYHPIQLQKILQFVLAFQKDRLEAVPPSCTLCNIIRRHWLTITMGIREMSLSHPIWRHTAHPSTKPWTYAAGKRLLSSLFTSCYNLSATLDSRTIIKSLHIMTCGWIWWSIKLYRSLVSSSLQFVLHRPVKVRLLMTPVIWAATNHPTVGLLFEPQCKWTTQNVLKGILL